MMTTEEINIELKSQLAPIVKHGMVRVIYGATNVPGIGLRCKSKGNIPLDFTVFGHANMGFEVFVNKIGDTPFSDSSPRSVVTEVEGLPSRIFIDGDKFQQEYQDGGMESAMNYSLYTQICQQLKPNSIFEIGVRAGYSAWAMLHGCEAGTSYLGLELDEGTYGGVHGYSEHAMRMLQEEFPESKVAISYGDSQVLTELPTRFDLISVDGAHHYDQALHDIEMCARHADWLIVDDVSHIAPVGAAVERYLADHTAVRAVFYETWRGHVLLDTRMCLRP